MILKEQVKNCIPSILTLLFFVILHISCYSYYILISNETHSTSRIHPPTEGLILTELTSNYNLDAVVTGVKRKIVSVT